MGRSQTLWSAGASLLALASTAASAADRCTVSWADAAVPSGPATFIVAGPQAAPSPRVVLTTVHTSATSVQGSVVATAPPGPPPGTASGSGPPGNTPASRRSPSRAEPKNDQERLVAAIFDGDAAGVQQLLGSPNVDVNLAQSAGSHWRPIEVAAMRAQPPVIRALIAHGARVDAGVRAIGVAMINLGAVVQPSGDPAGRWAPERTPRDFEATIGILLDAGADADGVLDPKHPESALDVLLRMPHFDGDMRIARLLVEHGAHLGADAPGGSPVALAIAKGRSDFVSLATEGRAAAHSELDAALGQAVASRDAESFERLLAAGASPDATLYGRPVLCATLDWPDQGHALARQLVEKGAEVNIDCPRGPPLTLAMGDRDLALLLLNRGADPNRPDRHGATALDHAPDTDHALVHAILARSGRVGLSDEDTREWRQRGIGTPGTVIRAMLHHQDYVAQGLLERDGLGGESTCAAIMYASAMDASGTLAELLRRGGDPNSVTDGGTTALMVAAADGEDAALSVLLAQRKIDVDGTTPREFHPPRFEIYSEERQPMWTGGRTALMYAAKGGHADSVRLLLQHGANPERKDAEGWTALQYARTPEVRRLLSGRP